MRGTTTAAKQKRRAMLLHLAGPDVQEIIYHLNLYWNRGCYKLRHCCWSPQHRFHFVPQVNSIFAHQTFHRVTQNPGATIQQFVTSLRKAAKDCDFATNIDNQIRYAVFNKCTFTYIKRKLLGEGQGLSLTRTLEVAEQCEKIETQLVALSVKREESESINKINERSNNQSTSIQGRYVIDVV